MKKSKKSGTYDVGYKKPPRTTQFKRGQSGNPKGRPKGSKNFGSHVASTFARKISVHEKGKERRISVAEAMLLKMSAKAIGGDMTAMRLAIGLLQGSQEDGKPIAETFTSESDRALLLAFLEKNAAAVDKGEPE
jgi:Family of unknown function (DUF5681)